MSQSLANVLVHIVFSTKNRVPFLKDRAVRQQLDAYTGGILRNLDSPSVIVKSVTDHTHILCRLSKNESLAYLVQEVKRSTSKWIKSKAPELRRFHWQNGYGGFSVGKREVPQVRAYISNQEEHHRQVSFQDELRRLLEENGIEYDERYLWD